MKKIVVFIFAVAAVSLGCAGMQQKPTEPERVKVASVDENAGRIVLEDGRVIICRKETPTGSNRPRNVCRWEDEIKAQALRDQDDTRTLLRNYAVITGR